ncbi:phytoene desaturase family protein [Halalkalibacter urbisdiaboli]|uniref:phytoene desaturase family protein n=1 Tax=Halalkalibacter urbisdiaboli TaxID=1960589 RepID=UPI000B43EDA0|nr:FAD-dependent oxidoreductase [Halalkalibacter urbisdiaboli]
MFDQKQRNSYDTVIIGAGLAGLIAANYLADDGLKVLILEKSANVGGRAMTIERKGCQFNLGPHGLYIKGEGFKCLNELNISLQGNAASINGIVTTSKKMFKAPFSPYSLLTSSLLSFKEKLEFVRIMSEVSRVDLKLVKEQTFTEWVDKRVTSKIVKQLIYTLTRLATYCASPHLLSAKAVLRQLLISQGGVKYINEGWGTIIQQLNEQATLKGVTILTRQNIASIHGEYPTFHVGLSNGDSVLTRTIICTASPSETGRLFKQYATPTLDSMLKASIPVKGAALDLALKRLPRPNLHFAMDLEQPLYYSNHSNAAHLSKNKAHQVIHAFRYFTNEEEKIDSATIKNELEWYIDRIQPGWKKEVVTSRFLPTLTVYQRVPQPRQDQFFSNSFHVRGLFVAGDWISPTSILADGSISSAKQAAMQIINEEDSLGVIKKRVSRI